MIRHDLKNGLSISEVCEKYNLTFKELYAELKHKPQDKEDCDNEKHIYLIRTRYFILKGGDYTKNYGSYFSLEEAIRVRDELVSLEWNVDSNDYLGDKYITCKEKNFKISKSWGKHKTVVYGEYRSLEDARKVRDALVVFDWDKDYLPLILKRLGVVRVER